MRNANVRIEKPTFLNSQFSILNLALAAPALLFLAVFYLWPLIEIARISFVPSEISQGQTPLTVLRDPAVAQVLGFSLWQAAQGDWA